MIELSIIKLFILNREEFHRFFSVINISYVKENYKDLYKVFTTVDNYYSRFKEAECISITDLESFYLSSYPVIKDADRRLLSSLLQRIDQAPVSDAIQEYLTEHRNRSIAGSLALKAFDVSEGRAPISDLLEIVSSLSVGVTEQSIFISDDLEELYNEQIHSPGLRWRLGWLNKSLGSLRRGDFGFIFARPESGKTTFLASEVTEFARQADRPILWCNNEEGGNKVMLRCYQAALGITSRELFADLQGNKEKFHELTEGRIKIYDDAGMTRRSIEAKCKELNPSLIIMDQIDKIKGFSDDRHDLMLKAVYQWARELAKTYAPVIGVCQAGGTGEGKKWLAMTDVDSSHTAKQGEADFIVGIGKSNDEGMGDVRFLNISKNKLLGDDDTQTELRHGKVEVLIKADIARYEEI